MATGAKPALDQTVTQQTTAAEVSEPRPANFLAKIIRLFTRIFELNERLGSTRQYQ
jgi:hypothetical protein